MKNKLSDLNNILFEQLERLTQEDLEPEKITAEIQRTTSVVQVADRIVQNARLQLEGAKFMADNAGAGAVATPATFGLLAATTAGKAS